MISIGFLTTLGVNVGDEFIRNGIRSVLDRSGISYSPLYINKHDTLSLHNGAEDEDQTVVNKFDACDLFIQSGAPVYWNLKNGSNSLTSEWHKWVWMDRLLATNEQRGPIFANLGAGSCQSWEGGPEHFLSNQDCVEFARHAFARARVTTVRDPLAKEILDSLECPAEALPCPALLAAARWTTVPTRPGVIGVNWMPLGSHYDIDGRFPYESWGAHVREMLKGLRELGRLWFIAHDTVEIKFQEQLLEPGERIFYSTAWRDYLDVYGACALVIANRVHGAVAAAGFGVPSVILGNDTRARIGEYLGLSIYRSGFTQPGTVIQRASELMADRQEESARLLALRKTTSDRYLELLQPLLHSADSLR
jgi:hypothetical protein